MLNRWFGYLALGLGLAFELVGIAAIFSGVGLILAILLSVVQEFWILAAAIALALSVRTAHSPAELRSASDRLAQATRESLG